MISFHCIACCTRSYNRNIDILRSEQTIWCPNQISYCCGKSLLIYKICLLGRYRIFQVRLSNRILRFGSVVVKLRNSNRSQDPDNGNNNHQLNNRKTSFTIFNQCFQHKTTASFSLDPDQTSHVFGNLCKSTHLLSLISIPTFISTKTGYFFQRNKTTGEEYPQGYSSPLNLIE